MSYSADSPNASADGPHGIVSPKQFLTRVSSHDPAWAQTASSTLLPTCIAANDCTWNLRLHVSSAHAGFDDYLAAQEKLYQSGARNFSSVVVLPAHTFQHGESFIPAASVPFSDWLSRADGLGLKTPRAKIAYGSGSLMLPRGRGSLQRIAHADITILSFSSQYFLARVSDPLFAGVAYKLATPR